MRYGRQSSACRIAFLVRLVGVRARDRVGVGVRVRVVVGVRVSVGAGVRVRSVVRVRVRVGLVRLRLRRAISSAGS